MHLVKNNFTFMHINFIYWIPIFLFGSIYLINLSKNIFEVGSQQKGKTIKN